METSRHQNFILNLSVTFRKPLGSVTKISYLSRNFPYFSELLCTKKAYMSIFLPFTNYVRNHIFLTFPGCFQVPIVLSNSNSNCSNLLDLRNLQEQVAFCYQKLFWPFIVRRNCSSYLKNWNYIQQFFLTGGQDNFGNKKTRLTIFNSVLSIR